MTTATLEELALPRKLIAPWRLPAVRPAAAVMPGSCSGKTSSVVAATASGKTFIGEMAGHKILLKEGAVLFLVPLVALAVQKYQRFDERYGKIPKAGILTGEQVEPPGHRPIGDRNHPGADLVGTYEGLDHMIRCGQRMCKNCDGRHR